MDDQAPPPYPLPDRASPLQVIPTPTSAQQDQLSPIISPVQAQPTSIHDPMSPTSAATLGQQYRDQLFAQCALGNHEKTTRYGICGIIAAIVLFPFGLICLFTDTEKKCARCGVRLEKK
ncbi:hypothetical protein NLJ89_g3341 [Agrocybe chaxingu]|uniref:Brain protein I3 n=1 Tax=Agrocybe chaxingu TaxID=84603 RepID=A0A9W8MWY9_9AGAR|nr:hypothetical protein NLJ89_g3341 [Agrocybe chaxingu]